MNPRLRLLIVVAFIVIILGVVVAFVLPGLGDNGGGGGNPDTVGTTPDNTNNVVVATVPPVPTVALLEIVVAIQPIARGARITPQEQLIGLAPWPEEALPDGALLGQEGLDFIYNERPRARFDLFQGQPILSNFVIPSLDQLAASGSDLASTIPDNRRAVSVPVDRITSVAYGIQPGDRVDVIVSFLFVDIDEEFQTILPNVLRIASSDGENLVLSEPVRAEDRGDRLSIQLPDGSIYTFQVFTEPSEAVRRPRLATQITIQNALIVGVGNFPLDGILFELDPTPLPPELEGTPATTQQQQQQGGAAVATIAPVVQGPDIVTLAVTPQEAVVLTYYIEAHIPITFALRSATDTSLQQTTAVTLGFIMSEYGIQLPETLPYSLQPAITSIRELIAGEQISLSDQ